MAIQEIPKAAERHYQHMLGLQAQALIILRRAWNNVSGRHVLDSWKAVLPSVLSQFEIVQREAAHAGTLYSGLALAQQNSYVVPDFFVDPEPLVGIASDGRSLEGFLSSPAYSTVEALREGAPTGPTLASGQRILEMLGRTLIADTARQAASIDIATRRNVGYVRMLNPPSCDRCTVLAGKHYDWNQGFLRHPQCDCVHVPATNRALRGAAREGLLVNPYEYFHSLSVADQEKFFGKNYAQAIREGADIFQVVNAKRGRDRYMGVFTTEGTTRHGHAFLGLKPGQKRLTPDGIYSQARRFNLSREETLGLLRTHSYLLPGRQNPLGSLRGQRSGFGHFGGGGKRKAASLAVMEARATGVRKSGDVYTMTAAEQRVYIAERNWREVQAGLNPYTEAAIERRRGVRPWSVDRPLTDAARARAEIEYRAVLMTGGEKFLRSGGLSLELAYRNAAKDYSIMTGADRAVASTGGSGRKPPTRRSSLPPSEAPKGPVGPHDEGLWGQRYRALAQRMKLHDEPLYPHEIGVCEKLLARGENIEWIPRSGRISTNDFLFHSRGGIKVEIKENHSGKSSRIADKISEAVTKARDNHGVVKGNFLIEIHNRVLSEKLRKQLSQYNKRRPDAKISRLWVLHSGGVLEEITLQ